MSKNLIAKGVALAFLGSLAMAPMASQAAPWVGTLDTTSASGGGDGILQNVTGFDWSQNGAAWVQGFDLTGSSAAGTTDAFTLTYQAFAASIGTSSPTPNLNVSYPGPGGGTYEYTVYATLNEVGTVLPGGGLFISTLPGGSWNIYFDTNSATFADQAAGTGFTDGTSIISGVFTGGTASFTATAPVPSGTGTGSGILDGTVTYVNTAYVNPAMTGSEVRTSLNYPDSGSGYTRPAAFDGAPTGTDSPSSFVLQADGSQNFTIPEPGTVALVGMSLLTMAAVRRRKKRA